MNLNVYERLVTKSLLGCDYCYRHVEDIKPEQRILQLDDGKTIPIIGNPGGRNRIVVPLSEAQ